MKAITKPSARLLQLLKPPTQLADALDWKKQSKTVATLHIGRDRIGVAVASHPDFGEVKLLPPLHLELVTREGNLRALAPSCVEALETLCDAHKVGSFLVWWPLQREGRPGARCGKVLHTLESLIAESDKVLTPRRPISLWTGDMDKDQHEQYAEDEWGRSSVYSRCSYDKTIHRASVEQYCHPRGSSASAVETWDEFCKQYWPHHTYLHDDGHGYDDDCHAKVRQAKASEGGKGMINVMFSQPLLSIHMLYGIH